MMAFLLWSSVRRKRVRSLACSLLIMPVAGLLILREPESIEILVGELGLGRRIGPVAGNVGNRWNTTYRHTCLRVLGQWIFGHALHDLEDLAF